MHAGTAEIREPVGLGLSDGVDLVKEPEEGTVDRVGDDCAESANEVAQIPRALLGKLGAAGVEELAARVGEGGGDERVAGSEVVDKHPGAGLEGVRELSGQLAGDEQFGRWAVGGSRVVTRSTRSCNVVTGIGG